MTYTYVYITWTPDLTTGNDLIDEQHKKLIAALNNLFDAHRNGRGRKEVEDMMDFLVKYTIKHFDDEEALQRKYEYAEHTAHKKIHSDFKNVAIGLHQELMREGPTEEFITKVYVIIGHWVVNHIEHVDIEMAACLKRNMEQA
jgi:hemerythrin